jgi:adenylylsulfate reductase subunit B
VKACPQNAIDDRGYSDFAPMNHKVRVLREPEKGTISWRLKFRDGREKNFVSPIRTTEWGTIKCASEYEAPDASGIDSQELAHEPDYLKAEGGLRRISTKQFKKHPIAKNSASSLKAAE